jgi:hypothetical protein
VTFDTRSKILPLSRSEDFADAVFVSMYLDPLTVDHARRLGEIAAGGRRVVVLLSDPPQPLLPLAARAELAAALASVSAVMVLPGELAFSEGAADLERREALVRHVWNRHGAAATAAV